jgi:hypothetical protein
LPQKIQPKTIILVIVCFKHFSLNPDMQTNIGFGKYLPNQVIFIGNFSSQPGVAKNVLKKKKSNLRLGIC